jgi:hypothetical protein
VPSPLGSPDRWLFGRWPDLLVGCGLGYIAFVPVLLACGYLTGVEAWPLGLTVAFGMLINAPHYGATVLRVYGDRASRVKYRFFALHATVALVLIFAIAVRSVWLASVLITIYVTWSPWHFAGQNYGLALMFLRRRGVEVDAVTKRFFHLSFVLSAALAMLAIHSHSGEYSVMLPTLNASGAPGLIALGIPTQALYVLFAIIATSCVTCLALAAWRLAPTGSAWAHTPAWILVCTQALWYVVPVLSLNANHRLPFAAVWISTAHSLQYLWVTAYYAERSPARERSSRFLFKALAAGTAVTILPTLLFSPDLLGKMPWDAGLAMTAFSIVNIHHFILDGAIWKLRDGAIARVLLRPPAAEPATEVPRRAGGRAMHAVVWTVAGLSLLVPATTAFEALGMYLDPGAQRMSDVAWRSRWIGRETVALHMDAGVKREQAGDDRAAIEHYKRAIELFPIPAAWDALGAVYMREHRIALAHDAYEHAVALQPDSPRLWFMRARLRLALAQNGVSPDPGLRDTISSLNHALEIKPDYAAASLLLARIAAHEGRGEEAQRILERGIADAGDAPSPRLQQALAALRQNGSANSTAP